MAAKKSVKALKKPVASLVLSPSLSLDLAASEDTEYLTAVAEKATKRLLELQKEEQKLDIESDENQELITRAIKLEEKFVKKFGSLQPTLTASVTIPLNLTFKFSHLFQNNSNIFDYIESEGHWATLELNDFEEVKCEVVKGAELSKQQKTVITQSLDDIFVDCCVDTLNLHPEANSILDFISECGKEFEVLRNAFENHPPEFWEQLRRESTKKKTVKKASKDDKKKKKS